MWTVRATIGETVSSHDFTPHNGLSSETRARVFFTRKQGKGPMYPYDKLELLDDENNIVDTWDAE